MSNRCAVGRRPYLHLVSTLSHRTKRAHAAHSESGATRKILDADHLVLIAGIVARKDLEDWIRRHRG